VSGIPESASRCSTPAFCTDAWYEADLVCCKLHVILRYRVLEFKRGIPARGGYFGLRSSGQFTTICNGGEVVSVGTELMTNRPLGAEP
jgi:hypothetical protein